MKARAPWMLAIMLIAFLLAGQSAAYVYDEVDTGGNDPVITGGALGWPGGDYFPNHDPDYIIVDLTNNDYRAYTSGDTPVFPHGYYMKYVCFNADGTKVAMTTRTKFDGVGDPYEIWVCDYDGTTHTLSNPQQITSTGGVGDVYENGMCSWSLTDPDLLLFNEIHMTTANLVKTYDFSTSTFSTLYDPALDTNGYDVTNPGFFAQDDTKIILGSGYNTGNDRILLFDGTYPSTTISSPDKNLDPASSYDGTLVSYYSTNSAYPYPAGSIYTEYSGGVWTEQTNGWGDPVTGNVPGLWAFYNGKSDDRILSLRSDLGWTATSLALYASDGTLLSDLTGDGGTVQWIYANHNWEGPGGEILFRAEENPHAGYGNNVFLALERPSTVWVDDDWTGPANCGGHSWGYDAYATIQEAIDAVEGSTINVAPGTYPERLNVHTAVDLRGAQYGVDPTAVGARTNPALESVIDASGLPIANPHVTVEIPNGVTGVSVSGFTLIGVPTFHHSDDCIVRCWDDNITISDNIMDGFMGVLCKGAANQTVHRNRMVVNKNGVVVQPNPGMNVTISDNYATLGTSPAGDESAFYMTGCSQVQITGNTVEGFVNAKAAVGSNVDHITISGNTFDNNKDAISYWGTTTFVTITGNTITNSLRYGVSIKGQDITISGNVITGSVDTGVNIDRNVIDTERVTITDNDLSGNTNCGVKVNTAVVTEIVDASGNNWGATDAGTVRASANAGAGTDYTPWLGGGTPQNPGYAGDYSTLYVDDDSPQEGGGGRIQEGVDLVTASTVNVLPGTYTETITFDAAFAKDDVSIVGDAGSRPIVDGGVKFANTGAFSGLTLENLYFKGTVAGQNRVFKNANTGAINNFTLDNCVIDGEDVAGRMGIAGNLFGGTLTITDSEIKDILGFAVMDIDSSSDYSPWGGNGLPFTTVTFSGNHVHHCNGTVSLRGHTPTRTTQVTVAGNTLNDIGGNNGEAGEQWAAIEVNHAEALDFYGNTIQGVQLGVWGEGQVAQLWDVGSVNMYGNQFTNNAQGLYFFGGSAGGSYGGPWPIPTGAIEYNNFSGNTAYGLSIEATATGGPLDAEMNWWGDASGPSGIGPGTGDAVLGNVDFDPWIGKPGEGYNVVCDPDPLQLNVASLPNDPDGQIAVKYLGGGGGLLFGYSVTVTWDDSVADLTGVTQGTLLSDAGTTQFFVYPATGNTRTIDCSLLGAVDGVTGPGTMFTLGFDADSFGTSPVNITLIAFRDNANHPLSGFFEDDGEIQVDITNPSVTGVAIENLTLSHTNEYAKNTDNLELTATVTDDYALTAADIVADLSTLLATGGTAVPAQSYASPTATWTLPLANVTLTADDLRTVTVTATDGLLNTGSGTDDITVDNTPPGNVTGFAAAPAHEEGILSWDDPTSPSLDANYYGIVVRYDAWGNYPYYDTGAPAYPPTHTAGDGEAFNGTGVVTGAVHAIVPRDIHYYSAFAYDWALNYGGVDAGGQDRSTNYWLGDVTTTLGFWDGYNGLVNPADIDKLAGNYGDPPPAGVPGYAECDVGPTHNNSPVGIPEPDDKVQFEDLMLFAMNYGVVAPRVVPFLPDEATKALSLELAELGAIEDGMFEVALRLEGNASEVKGLSTAIAYGSSDLEFVNARLSDDMSSPLAPVFFWHGSDGSSVQIDLAVLGTDVTVGGSGEVAILTFRALSDEYTLEFSSADLRGASNEALSAEFDGLESRPETPAAYRLVGNLPNPFNPVTKIAYDVPHEAAVAIRIYDVSGRLVRTLVDQRMERGRHEAVWNGRNETGEPVGSGVYFCTMDADEFHGSHKMTLLK